MVNTHFHCDHAGGNHHLQSLHGTAVAAHAAEAALVNRRDPEACRAGFLDQPVEPYTVLRPLHDGELVGTGESAWQVLATPGHTAGHIALWSADHRVLVSGDALHGADLGWVNPYQEGTDALDQAADTLERLARLPAARILPGHGPAVDEPAATIGRARRRIASWREDPHRMAWHACKRVFAYALMVTDGMTDAEADAYLRRAPWAMAHAAGAFGWSLDSFVPALFAECLRADAIRRDGALWRAVAPYDPPPPGWPFAPARPQDWPG